MTPIGNLNGREHDNGVGTSGKYEPVKSGTGCGGKCNGAGTSRSSGGTGI